jgi:uncharacterized membrane protein (UPF0127 family)
MLKRYRSSMKNLLAALLFSLLAFPALAQLPETHLTISGHPIVAEVAATDPDRTQGLMYRRMLPENRGMLFVFPQTAMHAMWMMNTYIPLSVAFLDESGVVVNIEDMEPHTRTTHGATRPARYALEANLGWFRKRGIKAGAKVEGLNNAPPPR